MLSKTSADCCKYFDVTIAAPNQSIYRKSNQFFILNESSYTLQPHQKCTIHFDVNISTSIPTVCILTCEPYMLKQNIYHEITVIKNNENLHITLYNNNDTPFIIQPFNCQVNCSIIAGSLESLLPPPPQNNKTILNPAQKKLTGNRFIVLLVL